jgi:hypothetical protein
MVATAQPLGESLANDDWSYARSVRHLHETSELRRGFGKPRDSRQELRHLEIARLWVGREAKASAAVDERALHGERVEVDVQVSALAPTASDDATSRASPTSGAAPMQRTRRMFFVIV